MIKIFNDNGRIWAVKITSRAPLPNMGPIVEFYDCRFEHTDLGQFVSDYYRQALLDSTSIRERGLCLDDGNYLEWSIGADTMRRILDWLAAN